MRPTIGNQIGALLLGGAICFVTIWALCLFDVSKPILPEATPAGSKPKPFALVHPLMARLLDRPLPAGPYIAAFLGAQQHTARGHPSYLFGRIDQNGFWYYFPVVAAYKIPLAITGVLLMGLLSLFWFRPRWDEWGLLLPMLIWAGLMISSNINIGWRHFLPVYVFALMLASRFLVDTPNAKRPWLAVVAVIAVGVTFVETLRYHPDYLCYINFPRKAAWMDISDSNIDWGQAVKYAAKWIKRHPKEQEIAVRDFVWGPHLYNVRQRLGPNVTVLDRGSRLPTSGIIIVSPVPLAGLYEFNDAYRALRNVKPIAILGHALRVYDLDRLRKKNMPFDWGPGVPVQKQPKAAPHKTKRPKRDSGAASPSSAPRSPEDHER